MKSWRAYKSLEWFIFIGFITAGFIALVAVATLASITRPVTKWEVPLASPTPLFQITDADRICDTPADCNIVFSECNFCGDSIAVNRAAAARIYRETESRCATKPSCFHEDWRQWYCVASRCTFTPALDTTGSSSGLSSEALASEETLAKEGWQTYRNDQRGYSIRYPADWTFAVYSDTNLLFNPIDQASYTAPDGEPKNAVIVDAAVMDNPQTIESIAQRGRNDGKTVRFLTVAGLPAVQHEDRAYIHAFVISGDMLYMMVYNASTNAKPTYDAMVGSFAVTTSPDPATWKTYENAQYHYRFQYPQNWIIKKNKEQTTVNITSPELLGIQARQYGYEGPQTDLSVRYYPSIADELENRGRPNWQSVTTIDELIRRNELIEKIGSTTVDGQPATEAIRGGLGTYYTVFITKDGHLYELFFESRSNKESLSPTIKKILTTFKFTQ